MLICHLLVLDLQRGQSGLELSEAEGELSLDLLLGDDLGHLTGSTGTQDEERSRLAPTKRSREGSNGGKETGKEKKKRENQKGDTDRVAHVGLETEALWRAEGGGVEAQQALPVPSWVQALHGPLQDLQARPPGGFKAQLGR